MAAPGAVQVINKDEVYLGGYRFPIIGAVRRMNISVPPNPVVFGDSTRRGDSQAMSEQIQSSNVGGAGVYVADSRTEFDVFWTSEAETRFNHAITMPPETVSMGKPSTVGDSDVSMSITFQNSQFFAFADEVYRWLDASSEWSALEYTLPGVPTDAIVWNGVLYVATGGGYSTRDAAGAWADVSDDAKLLTIWDGKLFRLAQGSGSWDLYSKATTGGAWSALLASITADIIPTQLLIYRDAAGSTAIYVVTRTGLWIYNADSARFDETEVRWPDANFTPKATVFRDGKMYVAPGGLGMLSVQSGSQFVVSAVGLDTKDGVPEDELGYINAIASDQNWVLALTVSASLTDEQDEYGALSEPFGTRHQWSATEGKTILRAFGSGWHRTWTSPSIGLPGSILTVGSSYDSTRVYWSSGGEVYYQLLDLGFFNPRQIGVRPFADGPVSHITPWFDYSAPNQEKIHGKFLIETEHCSAEDTVGVWYGIDKSDVWYLLGEITTDGLHEFNLGNPPSPEGEQGRYFRFKFVLTRTSDDNTSAPTIIYWTSQFMRILPETPGFAFTVNIRGSYKQQSAASMVSALFGMGDWETTPKLIKFAYNDHLSEESKTYYVRVTRIAGGEWPGQERRGEGLYQVSLIAPYGKDSISG